MRGLPRFRSKSPRRSSVYPADARALTAAELDRMAQLLAEAAGALPLFQAGRAK
jgi:hypothetical protein